LDAQQVYNTTFIRWTTHSPPGLSAKDVEMARFCDEQAAVFGEVAPAPPPTAQAEEGKGVVEEQGVRDGEGQTCSVGKELADRVALEGGDCCVPKRS
jgi:4a-hydroxytetrahydrobiopterin dehydratase